MDALQLSQAIYCITERWNPPWRYTRFCTKTLLTAELLTCISWAMPSINKCLIQRLKVCQNTHSCYVQYNATSRSYRKNMQSLKFHSIFYHDTFLNLLHQLNSCWCWLLCRTVSVALWRPTGYTASQTQLNQSSSNKPCVAFSFSSKTKQHDVFWGFFCKSSSLNVLSFHEPHKNPIVLSTSNMEDKKPICNTYQIGRDTWKCDFLFIFFILFFFQFGLGKK